MSMFDLFFSNRVIKLKVPNCKNELKTVKTKSKKVKVKNNLKP